jgi:hypothetical protein
MNGSRSRSVVALLLLFLLGSAVALAQTARLSGQVTDTEGLPIPGAKVQVIHQGDRVKQETTTDQNGAYSVVHLGAGDYQVVVDAPGFGHSISRIVTLTAAQAEVVPVQLAVATTATEVNVNAENSGAVTLDTASISGTISQKEVTGYGLNGRNFSQLITLTPGVSNQSGQDEAKVGVTGSAKFSVNGGRVEYNTFDVDGSDVLNTSINASRGQGQPLMVYPSVDAIQEVQVLTSNYSAMYGKSASGSVLVTTKSGGAAFHGNFYGFIRNELFNARNYFDQPDAPPAITTTSPVATGKPHYRTPLYRRQDYGGTFGGPLYIPGHYNVKKDKTFFFFSEELRLEKTPVDYNQAVPTVAERNGDFSDVCPFIQPGGSPSPSTVGYPDCPVPTGSTPRDGSITGEHVNVNYLSQAILNTNIIPLPNSQSGCNSSNPTAFNRCYVASVSPPTYFREELFRIDHAITPTEQLTFRYIHDAFTTTTLTPQYGVVQNSFPTIQNGLASPGLDMVLGLTQTLPHSFLNRITLAFAVEHISLTPATGPGVTSLARPAILDNASPAVTGGVATPASPVCSVVTGPTPTPLGQGTAQQLTECPMGSIFSNGFNGKMPGLVFQGNNGAYGGHGFNVDTGFAPYSQSNPTYTVRDDVGKTVGKHTFQFGFEANYTQQNEQSAASGANSGDQQGLLTFSNQQSKYTTGNAFADFLAGPGIFRVTPNSSGTGTSVQSTDYSTTAIKSFTQDSGARRYYNRYKAAEFYLQDDFRVTPRLTINMGLRVSLFGQWYNPNGTAYNWDPKAYNPSLGASIFIDPNFGELVRTTTSGGAGLGSLPAVPLNLGHLDPTITNGLVQCGSNGVPDSCMKNHLFNPGPRIGVSFDPTGTGRTSIRAGYGLFWEHGTGAEANVGSLIGSAPLVLSETQTFPTPVDIGVPGAGIANSPGASPFSGALNSLGKVCTANCTLTTGSTVSNGTFPLNVTSIPTEAHYAYTQQWSLSVQHELRKNLVGTLAYVGTRGTHLATVRNLNQLPALPPGLNPFPAGQPLTSDICGAGAQQGVFPVNGTFPVTGNTTSPGIGPNQPGYLNAFIACTGSTGFKNGNNVLGVSPDTLRPYTGFSNIISVENVAASHYHGLQGSLSRKQADLTLGLTYTYSHSIDDASDRSSQNFADALNVSANRASSDFDQRQLINVSYIYELPLLRMLTHFTGFIKDDAAQGSSAQESSQAPGKLAKALLADWELSGITIYQTGTPFSVINGGGTAPPTLGLAACANSTSPSCQTIEIAPADNAGVGNGIGIGSFADIAPYTHGTKPVVPSSLSNVGPLLGNPLQFVAPRGLTFGNSGRNYLNNPSRTNFNMALLKHFKAYHESNVEFRIEAFNVFNHTQFRIYDPSHPGNTGNNVINCYGNASTQYSAGAPNCLAGNSFLHPVDAHDPRILQLGLKVAF